VDVLNIGSNNLADKPAGKRVARSGTRDGKSVDVCRKYTLVPDQQRL
jgi:hypothetical protein